MHKMEKEAGNKKENISKGQKHKKNGGYRFILNHNRHKFLKNRGKKLKLDGDKYTNNKVYKLKQKYHRRYQKVLKKKFHKEQNAKHDSENKGKKAKDTPKITNTDSKNEETIEGQKTSYNTKINRDKNAKTSRNKVNIRVFNASPNEKAKKRISIHKKHKIP